MRRQDLEKVAEIVRERNLFVLSDEIYGELTYGGEPHVSFRGSSGHEGAHRGDQRLFRRLTL